MSSSITPGTSTKTSKPSSGMQAGLQVVGSFFLYINSLGMINSYGAFQSYYATELIPSEPSSKIAWIGSMQAFLLFFVGSLSGPLLDAGYLIYLLTTGTVLIFLGMMMTSLSTQYYQLMLAQGIMIGLGTGCLFLPSVSIIPQWFDRKKSTMYLGIMGTGSAVGGIIFPVIFKNVLASSGFGWAVRAVAFVTFPTNLAAIAVLRMKNLPVSKRQLLDFGMFHEFDYWLTCAVNFFGFAGLYIPIFFLEQYALTYTTISRDVATYLVPIIMAGSFPGRLIPSILAMKYGIVEVTLVDLAVCALLCFCWIAVKSGVGGLVVYSIIYGFASGGFTSLAPAFIIGLAPSMDKIGTRIGMCSAIFSLGVLMGNPVAGAILNDTHEYVGLQCFAAAMLLAATAFAGLVLYRRIQRRREEEQSDKSIGLLKIDSN